MGLATGVASIISVQPTTASVSAISATGGSSPYSLQWYRSTTSGFVPAAGNAVSGATTLGLNDSGLQAGTTYYYKMVTIDSAAASVTTAQLGLATAPAPNQNQFAQSTIVGKLDQAYNYDTMNVQVDASEAGILYPGTPVKIVDSAGGVPKVVACAANSDSVLGFVTYNVKDAQYVAGDRMEISLKGNVMWLIATAAIARGARVENSMGMYPAGGVRSLTGSSGASYVGWALDKAPVPGTMIRVYLECPSFEVG